MNKMTGIIMMLLGITLLVSGYIIYSSKSSSKLEKEMEGLVQAVSADGVFTEKERKLIIETAEKYKLNADNYISSIEEKISANSDEAETEIIDHNIRNGLEFEKFIVRKFSQKYYKLVKWAGDKYVEGIYSEENTNPDLIMEFSYNSYSRRFAIECKWRKNFYKEQIEFTYDEQLGRYKKFSSDNNIDVYIALGIGGKGESPKELYLIPLRDISKTSLTREELSQYKKNPNDWFFYDIKNKILDITPFPS